VKSLLFRCSIVAPLLAAYVSYLLFSWSALSLPGLQYDEVLFANAALGHLDDSFLVYEWDLAGLKVPVMLMSYIGALKAYIYAVVFNLFPTSPASVRLPVTLLGLATLFCIYKVSDRMFGKGVALCAAWVVATDPSYIYHVRLDMGPVTLMLFLKMLGLLWLLVFVKSQRPIHLAVAAFTLGLGIFDKANFLWFVIALPLAAFFVWRGALLKGFTAKNFLIGMGFLALGCFPFIVYNLARGGETFEGRLLFPDKPVESVARRTGLLIETLNGSGVYRFVNGQPPSHWTITAAEFPASLAPWVVAILMVGVSAYRVTTGKKLNAMLCFTVLLSWIITAQIFFTHLAIGWHHFMMLWPFPQLALAFCCTRLIQAQHLTENACSWPRGTVPAVGIVLLVCLLTSNVVMNVSYLRSFVQEGGRGFYSDAIYDLVKYSVGQKKERFLLMDWGFNNQMLLLSRGQVRKEEVFWQLLQPQSKEDALAELEQLAQDGSSLFVFHAPAHTVFNQPIQLFDEMLTRRGWKSKRTKVFFHRRGDPVYFLLKVEAEPGSITQ
jgi:4-amino-4-deoxy-L-arabinose transferase-like glycosyltransferase